MKAGNSDCELIGGWFFVFMSLWSIVGVAALIHSMARLRMAETSRVADRTVSLTVAIVFGPLYWIYILSNK